jgi:hypothetical protein
MVDVELQMTRVSTVALSIDDCWDAVSIQQGENIIWIPVSELKRFTAAFGVFNHGGISAKQEN